MRVISGKERSFYLEDPWKHMNERQTAPLRGFQTDKMPNVQPNRTISKGPQLTGNLLGRR